MVLFETNKATYTPTKETHMQAHIFSVPLEKSWEILKNVNETNVSPEHPDLWSVIVCNEEKKRYFVACILVKNTNWYKKINQLHKVVKI